MSDTGFTFPDSATGFCTILKYGCPLCIGLRPYYLAIRLILLGDKHVYALRLAKR